MTSNTKATIKRRLWLALAVACFLVLTYMEHRDLCDSSPTAEFCK